MSLSLEQKKTVVDEVTASMSSAQTAILAEYRGLTVSQMTGLRTEARNTGVFVRVVKNTLAKRVVDGTDFDCLKEHMVGPVVLASSEDPVACAKVVSKFAKDYERLNITAGAMNGSLLTMADIEALAKLPGREELLSKLIGTMQAPMQKFVATLNGVPQKFVRTLVAVNDAKQEAA
ncbi:MAG: 50S ribosomal protein L10 [Arenicellales bacterium WSBS_2016_MAG_OTU3]